MDLTQLSNNELKVLDTIFCSFDQGDVRLDLEGMQIHEEYRRMRNSITRAAAFRRLLEEAQC